MAAVPVPTKKRIGAGYCQLMEEILIRDELLHNAFAQDWSSVSVHLMPEMELRAKVEYAYLQLRMICELIALACLTAHGDIVGAAQLGGEYDADKIIKRLDELHPDFYPKPYMQAAAKDANGIWQNQPVTSGFLSKSELLSLYGRCGGFLHQGGLKKRKAKRSQQLDPWDPKHWADKAWILLKCHIIQTIHPDVQLHVIMKDKDQLRPQLSYSTLEPGGIWRIDLDGISRARE